MPKFFLPGILIVTALVIAVGIFLASSNQNAPASPITLPSSYVYYWGDGCPHCAVVEEFMATWDKKDKVSLEKKEVRK